MYRRPAAVLLCVFALSCGGESGPNGVDIGSIVVTPNPVALAQQASLQLQVSVLDDAGTLLTGVPVTFASGSTDLVTVSNTGMVVSVGPAGVSTITVSAGDVPVQVPVTVSATGNTIRMLPSPAVVAQLQTLQLDVALLDLVGSVIPGTSFNYSSSNEGVATVNAGGLVRSIGPSGPVTITATTEGLPAGDLSAQVQLTVTQVPASLELLPNPIAMARHATAMLTARVLDAFGEPIPDAAVTFAASPASLLAVSSSGLLTAGNMTGSGMVTATSGALSGSVPVTVVDIGELSGAIVATLPVDGQEPYGVIIGPSGAIFGVGIGGLLHIGQLGSAVVATHAVSSTLTIGIARNPVTGVLYVSGNGEDALLEVDPLTGGVLRRWAAPNAVEQMFDVAVSPDGQHVYVGGDRNAVYRIAAASLTTVAEYPGATAVVHLLVHPSQPFIYASGVGEAKEINVETAAQRTFSIPAAQASALALSGDRLFVGGEVAVMGVIDLASGTTTTTGIPGCGAYDVVASPDGRSLLVTCPLDGVAKILDTQTLIVAATVSTGGTPRRAAISADGTSAVIANQGGWYSEVE